jgi:hypothetical protein
MTTPAQKYIIERMAVDANGCWIWQLGLDKAGYGRALSMLAHRYAYRAFKGPLIVGMHIDHTCANKACVNPEHLQQITPKQHSQFVAQHQTRKLLPDDVKYIRSSSESAKHLATQFGVSDVTIRNIRKGKAYTHVT